MSMFAQFIDFWTLRDPNVVWVLIGSTLLGASAGAIGCFTFLRKRSLVGDALAHAALPGVTTSFLIFQNRSPVFILVGAASSCFLGYLAIDFLTRRTKIKEDSALAIVLSLFFAIGIFQLTLIQKIPTASQAGIDKLLFGQAASLISSDVILLSAVAGTLLLFLLCFFRPLKMITFDREFSECTGLNVQLYDLLLAITTVFAIVVGLQLVGVVLMAALLLTPCAAARNWSDTLSSTVCLAGIFGAVSGALGANVSYIAPNMPTGPWIVVVMTAIFSFSLIFAPTKGLFARKMRRIHFNKRIAEENLLRTFYKQGEDKGVRIAPVEPSEILTHRQLSLGTLERSLHRLIKKGKIARHGDAYTLTAAGLIEAEKITRSHRLWELYLSHAVSIPPDHVHADAEEMEHILTDELVTKLEAELESVKNDPHGKSIPLSKVEHD